MPKKKRPKNAKKILPAGKRGLFLLTEKVLVRIQGSSAPRVGMYSHRTKKWIVPSLFKENPKVVEWIRIPEEGWEEV